MRGDIEVHRDPTAADVTASITAHRHGDLVAPDGIWRAGDGALWIADTGADRLVRFDPRAGDAGWSFHGGPPDVEGPFDIKQAEPDDGRLWFTNKSGGTIASVVT